MAKLGEVEGGLAGEVPYWVRKLLKRAEGKRCSRVVAMEWAAANALKGVAGLDVEGVPGEMAVVYLFWASRSMGDFLEFMKTMPKGAPVKEATAGEGVLGDLRDDDEREVEELLRVHREGFRAQGLVEGGQG